MKRAHSLLLLMLPLAAQAQATNVVLVHGFLEQSDYWNYAASQLQATGNYNPIKVPAVVSSDPIPTQASVLTDFLGTFGLGPNTILVGHSQGGLVSRYASRSSSVSGLLTVASPNGGAPLVAHKWVADSYLDELAWDGWLADVDLADLEFSDNFSLYNVWVTMSGLLGGAVFDVSLGIEVYYTAFLNGHPNLADLAPGSGIVSSLMFNPGLEMATRREAIAFDDGDFFTGPWRAIYDEQTAQQITNSLSAAGFILAMDGFAIAASTDPNDPNWGAHQDGGAALEQIGAIIVNLPWIWNLDIVGGVPNDGVLPTAVHALPDRVPIFGVTNVSHNEAIFDGTDIIRALNIMTGR